MYLLYAGILQILLLNRSKICENNLFNFYSSFYFSCSADDPVTSSTREIKLGFELDESSSPCNLSFGSGSYIKVSTWNADKERVTQQTFSSTQISPNGEVT